MLNIQLDKLNRGAEAPDKTIANAEGRYIGKINEIAGKVLDNNLKVVLLAGPSASGKTTTANLIADTLSKNGKESFVISLDDFYRSRMDKDYPLLEDGTPDYESPNSLCLDEIRHTLSNIAEGKNFVLPKFDFKQGARVSETEHSAITNGCVIVEGLHALNPLVADSVEKDRALKTYVSVLTKTMAGEDQVLSCRKERFVRRLVRDSIFRASSAERTLGMWDAVFEGEKRYLYPFQETADVVVDSFHYYELGVLKDRALEILVNSTVKDEAYVREIIEGLQKLQTIDLGLVPDTSLIREFTAGGVYEKIY